MARADYDGKNHSDSYPVSDVTDLDKIYYIFNAYRALKGIDPTQSQVLMWKSRFESSGNAEEFYRALILENDFSTYFDNLTSEEQVIALYQGLLEIEPEDKILNIFSQSDKLNILGLVDFLIDSDDFAANAVSHGICPRKSGVINYVGDDGYYFSGGILIGGWRRINDKRFYFDPDDHGKMVKGWKYIDGYHFFFDESTGELVQDTDAIIGPQDEYYLTVNCETNVVMVYAWSEETEAFDIPVKVFVCSTGRDYTPTVQGTFTVHRLARWRELQGEVWGQYCSRVWGNYFFHSICYWGSYSTGMDVNAYNNLGTSVSHGCIRLTVASAKWIYDNCSGSTVEIYYADEQDPFDTPVLPEPIILYNRTGADPSDPNINPADYGY